MTNVAALRKKSFGASGRTQAKNKIAAGASPAAGDRTGRCLRAFLLDQSAGACAQHENFVAFSLAPALPQASWRAARRAKQARARANALVEVVAREGAAAARSELLAKQAAGRGPTLVGPVSLTKTVRRDVPCLLCVDVSTSQPISWDLIRF